MQSSATACTQKDHVKMSQKKGYKLPFMQNQIHELFNVGTI